MPLFYIKDDNRSAWVVAPDYAGAVCLWVRAVAKQNGYTEDEIENCKPSRGINFICEDSELILDDSGDFFDESPGPKKWHRNIDETLKHFILPLFVIPDCIAGEVLETLQDMILVRISKWTDDELQAAEAYATAKYVTEGDTLKTPIPERHETLIELERFVTEACSDLTKGAR